MDIKNYKCDQAPPMNSLELQKWEGTGNNKTKGGMLYTTSVKQIGCALRDNREKQGKEVK